MNRDKLVSLSGLACSRLKDHAPLLARIRAANRPSSSVADQSWYRIENAAKTSEADVWIYEDIYIGAGDEFAREVAALDVSVINLHLNSPGGYVFDGIAIHNTLIRHPATVNVTVDGVAASMGSVIAMAGDTVVMGRGTSMMVHLPAGLVAGQAVDMREMADLLDQLGGDIAGFYAARAGGSVEQWLASMAETTWYSAQKAVDAGLADSVLGAADAPPESHVQPPSPPAPPSPDATDRSTRSAQIRARHDARRQEARGK